MEKFILDAHEDARNNIHVLTPFFVHTQRPMHVYVRECAVVPPFVTVVGFFQPMHGARDKRQRASHNKQQTTTTNVYQHSINKNMNRMA